MNLIDAMEDELLQTGSKGTAEPLPPYVVLRLFSSQIDGTLASFRPGQVLTDQLVLRALLASNAPIEVVGEGLTKCPNCGSLFHMAPPRIDPPSDDGKGKKKV